MSAEQPISAEADDLLTIAQAMCRTDGVLGAPCACGWVSPCSALDVYGDQARAVREALLTRGRLADEPVSLTPELIAGFFESAVERRRREGLPPPMVVVHADPTEGFISAAEAIAADMAAYHAFNRESVR